MRIEQGLQYLVSKGNKVYLELLGTPEAEVSASQESRLFRLELSEGVPSVTEDSSRLSVLILDDEEPAAIVPLTLLLSTPTSTTTTTTTTTIYDITDDHSQLVDLSSEVVVVGQVQNNLEYCAINKIIASLSNLESMMMTNISPVMLPPIADYGILTPTLGIKVSFVHFYEYRCD
ncbi:hypothetical protein M0804_006087 [Polistes exclamans]|nr:hypothetical protein M0804_006087 [Polistes exclamans]